MGGVMRSRLPAINTRVLTAVLVVAIPVLLIGAAVVLSIGQKRLHDSAAARLSQSAEYTAATVDAYVFRRILDAAVLGRVPEVRRVAAAGSAIAFDQAAVTTLDRQWEADRPGTAGKLGVLRSPASQFVADIIPDDTIY